MSNARTRERLLLMAALLAGILLSGWLAWSRGVFAPEPPTVKKPVREAEMGQEAVPDSSLRGRPDSNGAALPPAEGRGQSSADAGLTVLVRKGEPDDVRPVTDGSVVVFRDPGSATPVRGLILEKDIALRIPLDHEGKVILDPGDLPESGRIAAISPRLRTTSVELPENRQGEVTIHLCVAASLTGTALTPDGTPVEGVLVLAGRPGTDLVTYDGRINAEVSARQDARTNGRGVFIIEGLDPNAPVVLAARKDGYTFSGIEVAAELKRYPMVPAGTRAVIVRMKPVLYGCFRAKNARTRETITDRLQILRGKGGIEIRRHVAGISSASTSSGPFARNDPSLVQWTTHGSTAKKVQLHVKLAGYEPALVAATARPLEEFVAQETEEVAFFTESQEVETGNLVLRFPESLDTTRGPPVLNIRLDEFDSGDDRSAPVWGTVGGQRVKIERAVPTRSVLGVLQEDGSWMFPNVPAGQRNMQIGLGTTRADDVPYQLGSGRTLSQEVTLSPVTGAVLLFRDEAGQQVFGVRYKLTPASGGLPATSLGTGLRLSPEGSVLPPRPQQLAPGRWHVLAFVPGLGQGEAVFEVAESQTVTVEVVIATE